LNKIFQHKGDKTIWAVFFILSAASLLMVYSASSSLANKLRDGNHLYFLFKQLSIIVLGYGAMLLFSRIKYSYFQWMSKALLFLVITILGYTMISGTNINNASRWLTIPFTGISFQSSDFAKIVLLTFLARGISKLSDIYKSNSRPEYWIIANIFFPAILISALIVRSNLSTALLIFVSAFYVMWLGKVKIKYLLALVSTGLLFAVILFFVAKSNPNLMPRFDTWVSRIENYGGNDTQDGNYQVTQAKIAIASNPLFGTLPGKSSQRVFLPSAHSDFIYAIIIEEYGTFVGFFILILYLILLYRALQISKKSETKFGALLAMGLIFSIVLQAFINMGVAVSLLPVTGQPLPLVSLGGTSFVFTSMALGMVQSVSVGLKKEKETTEILEKVQ